jgi:hypothetical protein
MPARMRLFKPKQGGIGLTKAFRDGKDIEHHALHASIMPVDLALPATPILNP